MGEPPAGAAVGSEPARGPAGRAESGRAESRRAESGRGKTVWRLMALLLIVQGHSYGVMNRIKKGPLYARIAQNRGNAAFVGQNPDKSLARHFLAEGICHRRVS